MEKKWIFETFRDWYTYLWKACRRFIKGFLMILWSLLMGIVSVLVYCGKQIEAFCRRETVAAVIVGSVIVLLILGWVFTFVNGRVAQKTAEHQRDSISYCLSKYMQAYDSTSVIVVDQDTIYNGR